MPIADRVTHDSFATTKIVRLTAPIFTILEQEISGRDLILLGGGLFLLYKSSQEMWENLEGRKRKRPQM